MKHNWPSARALSLVLAMLVIMVASCGPVRSLPTVTPTQTAAPTAAAVQSTAPPEVNGLTPEAAATLGSVEQVDPYPLYVMHYVGNYDFPPRATILPEGTNFGCSLFAAFGNSPDSLYGRNFDWQYSPAMLLYTDPPDGYAAVSMVNLLWLQMDWKLAGALARAPLAERSKVLSAPAMPLDGMNEYGLVIGMALVTDGSIDDASFDASRPTIGPLGIIRQMLDHARNVDEAVELFTRYNIDFSGAVPIHYLLADPSGKAMLLEFHDQQLVKLPNYYPWHMATNHLRCIAQDFGGCWRYEILFDRLVGRKGKLDPAGAMQLLSDVKLDSTQWSAVYNMNTGDINLAMGTSYDKIHTFHLDLIKP